MYMYICMYTWIYILCKNRHVLGDAETTCRRLSAAEYNAMVGITRSKIVFGAGSGFWLVLLSQTWFVSNFVHCLPMLVHCWVREPPDH